MDNIVENNKLIAEFMGGLYNNQAMLSLQSNEIWLPYHGVCNYKSDNGKSLKYHSDWNWLMRVVEKIEKIPEKNDNWFNVTVGASCYCIIQDATGELSFEIIGDGRTKIEATYNACIEFIKWYNEQNKK